MGRMSVIFFMAEGSIGKTKQAGGWQQFKAFPANFLGDVHFPANLIKATKGWLTG
jgi:hypothetical protein